jgi:F420-dependent methylenetetrahydromethanopterin dehydrogenase
MWAAAASAYGPYALAVVIGGLVVVAFIRGWIVSAPFADKQIERYAEAQKNITEMYKRAAETAIEALRVEQSNGAAEREQVRRAMVELIDALREFNEA